MVLPLTLSCQVLQLPQDKMLEDGYDADTQLGPSYKDAFSEEVFVSIDEVAPDALALNITPLINTRSGISEMKREDTTKMKVNGVRI